MTVAEKLEPLLSGVFDGGPPVRIRAWDGSETGPPGDPVLVLRSRRALRHFLWHPREVGFGRAYVSGDLDVEGDLGDGLRAFWTEAALRGSWSRTLLPAVRLGVLGPPPRAAGGHTSMPTAFGELVLDESMSDSCAYFDDDDLAKAQRAKLGLVCRELGLRPGMRLLDVGCGWGSLAVYAAAEFGVEVTGITRSKEQAAYARARAKGLPVEIRVADHQDLAGRPYDAVAAIEVGEHVEERDQPAFASRLFALMRPGASVLVQQTSRPACRPPGGEPFIEGFVAPGTHRRPVTETVGLLQDAGLEVQRLQSLRTDYVRTAAAWTRNLAANWDEAAGLLGVKGARAWRLRLAGLALAFEQDRMGVEQIRAVRPEA